MSSLSNVSTRIRPLARTSGQRLSGLTLARVWAQRLWGPAIGLAVTGSLLAWVHTTGIGAVFIRVGWGLLILVLLHQLTVAADSVGWHAMLSNLGLRLHRRDTLWIASVRNAAQTLIPLSASGFIAGVRLLQHRGVPTATALAGLIAEGTIATLAELLTIIMASGLFLLGAPHISAGNLKIVFSITAVLAAVLVVILWAQLNGRVFKAMSLSVQRFFPKPRRTSWTSAPLTLKDHLHQLYSRRWTMLFALFWQLMSLLCGAVEIWYILILLHTRAPFVFALLLQGLGRATRSFGFLVPSGWGLQEGVYALLAPLAGLTPALGLAVSLVTRLRDVIFALPFLASWHWYELHSAVAMDSSA